MPPLTEEQQQAIDSIDEHVLVSAGAGSGKTFVLVERYIQVLATDRDAEISDIIAVTYTRKAAEEMRSRLKSRLKELAAAGKSEEEKRWLKCLAEVETARIGTIHSLCESILKNYPAEAGIDPGFEIMGELERAELLAESIDQSLHFVIEKPMEYFAELLEYPIELLRTWLADFLRSSLKYKEARNRFSSGSLEAIKSFAESFIQDDTRRTLSELWQDKKFISDVNYLKQTPCADPASKLGILQSEMLRYLAQAGSDDSSYIERFHALEAITSMEPARSLGGVAGKEIRDCMRGIRNAAKATANRHQPKLNDSDQQAFILLRALIMLTDDALSRYNRLKQEHQKLDFDDLIERSQILLSSAKHISDTKAHRSTFSTTPLPSLYEKDSGFALRQICKKLRAVLVDEFQDTNWIQAKLMTALASQRARLFLIGDDKQSIYKFQGADVGTFNSCKSYISSLAHHNDEGEPAVQDLSSGLAKLQGRGRQMTLSQSFRSHPHIVNFVNYVFQRTFDNHPESEKYKSRFQALRPARQAGAEDENNPHVDICYTPCMEEDNAESRLEADRHEAQLLSIWIKQKIEAKIEIYDKELKLNRPLKYSDFAVLLQANSDFAFIEKALTQAELPFVSIAGSGFLDRQEIIDLENVLRWLSCPQDSHALFAVLRSPIFGCSDDLLHELKAGKDSSLWQCLNQKVRDDARPELKRAQHLLHLLQRESGQLALPDLLLKVVLESSYDLVLLGTPAGRQKSRNIFKFIAMATENKHMSISEFLASLKSMRDLGVKNLTDAPLSSDNAVKIMTIHKSKGLEFPAVALPRLGRSAHQYSGKLLFGKDLAIALDCTRDIEEEKPAFFQACNNLSRRMDEEEKKRLLYVALTRPRDFLAVFISPRATRGTNFGSWLIKALNLPTPDGLIEAAIVKIGTTGENSESCSFNLRQATLQDGAVQLPLAASECAQSPGYVTESASLNDGFEQESSDRSDEEYAAQRNASERYADAGDGTQRNASERSADEEHRIHPVFIERDDVEQYDMARIDFSLLDEDEPEPEQKFTPVPWQALLRVCPAQPLEGVHQTIAGNYFHLLMSKLGPELTLPSEAQRRSLFHAHEIAVQDPIQQEMLLSDSERLLINFKNSSLYALLKSARRRFEESAYLIIREDFEEELRPDLIFEDSEGNWHIVDYKTDHFEMRQLSKQVSAHQAQLSRYVADLETLVGVKAKPWIYFAQIGRLEPVDLAKPLQLSLF